MERERDTDRQTDGRADKWTDGQTETDGDRGREGECGADCKTQCHPHNRPTTASMYIHALTEKDIFSAKPLK